MKSWIVIPAMGAVSAAAVIAVTREPFAIATAGLAGAALASCVRAISGITPAAIAAAVLAPLLVIASFAEHHFVDVNACLAIAAIAWTIALLARTTEPPVVALLPALVATILEPAAVVLLPIAGTRLVTSPGRPKWAVAIPIAGGLAVMLALVAGMATDGVFATLGRRWFGSAPHANPDLAHHIADAIGPLTAVAALAGIALIAKLRLAEVAALGCAAGALLVDMRAGSVGAATLGMAGLLAALAIGRFAAIIRMPPLQAIAGATAAAMLLVPPVWTIVESVS